MVITDDRLDPPITDELLFLARAGDAQAFCDLVDPLQARLLRQAAALAGDLSAAEDLVSETLVEAWKSLPRYDETCRFSTWLCAILLHRHQKSLRRARSRPVSLARLPGSVARETDERQQNLPATGLSPAQTLAQNEAFLHVRQCVEQLPEKHRRVIWLRFFEEAALPEMAALLGCSVGTVKSRLYHALEKLRKMKVNLSEVKGDTTV